MRTNIEAELISINVGKPQRAFFQEKEISTGIFKNAVEGKILLTTTNFEGDEQADMVHHGGPDKAVCVYAYEHYPHWEQELGRTLAMSAFGENLTTRGIVETDVCIGDIFELGEAMVQISQPRQPCFKIGVKHGRPDLGLLVQQSGYTGFYFRVLREGAVSKNCKLRLTSRHPLGVTIAYANSIMHEDKKNEEGMKRILAVDSLSASWQNTFRKRLAGLYQDSSERLNGIG